MNANNQKKTCQYCRWYKIARGEYYLPFPHAENEMRQINVEFCCFNPPTSGLFPWSFGETSPDATCSKWEAGEDHPADRLQ